MRFTKHSIFLVMMGAAVLQAQGQLTANFSANNTNGCSPFSLVVSFQDISTGNPTSWLWQFGDAGNSFSTLQNPTFIYNQPGCYDVTLIVSNGTQTDTLTRTCFVEIRPQPEPGFVLNVSEGCAPLTVTLTDTSIANAASITSWTYVLSDGSFSNAQNPTFTFNTAPDTISVALTVMNSNGCQAIRVFQDIIRVYQAPTVDFTLSPNSACNPPLAVNFSNLTQLNGASGPSYQWSFPGGVTPGGASTFTGNTPPPITYTANGQYDVSLILVSANGCRDTVVKDNVIGIGGVTADFTASTQAVCLGEPISFQNTSTGGVTSVAWNFGVAPGVNSTINNPTFTYPAPGTYTVTLQANNPQCGDTLVRTSFITVNPLPVSSFTVDHDQDCRPGLPYQFTNLSTGAASLLWQFGDGSTSTQANPSHTYANFGTYNACLIVTNAGGCRDTFCRTITIAPPTVAFTRNPADGCTPVTVNFTDNSSSIDQVTGWQWNFGGPGAVPATSNQQNPTATFTVPGLYTVTLIVTTSTGCTDTLVFNNAVRAGTPPQVGFTVDKDSVCINEGLTFSSTFTDPDWRYYWDFQYVAPGNFVQLTDTVPTLYPDTGIFSVALYIDNQGCRDTLVIPDMIVVSPPRAEFLVSDSIFCSLPDTVVFTDESIGPADINRWFVNGVLYSTLQTPPPLVITSPGVYDIVQVIENSVTGCIDSFNRIIRAGNPVADFTATPLTGCRPLTVQFTNQSQNTVAHNWAFAFGLNVPLSGSSSANPVFTYQDTGFYTIRYTAIDQFGCFDQIFRNNYIRVDGAYASFTSPDPNACPGEVVQFQNSSTTSADNIVSWLWNFGDPASGAANTSTLPNPTHIYSSPGAYSVTLTVTDNQGCSNTVTLNNFVNITFPQPNFTVDDDSTCAGNPLLFTSTSTGVGLTYQWLFEGGGTATGDSAQFPFPAPGQYDVALVATDVNGCRDTLSRPDYIFIEVFEANFGGDPTIAICPPLNTQFTDSTVGNVASWLWNFGDGFGASILQNPGYVFFAPGVYDVRLIATHEDGCRDTLIRQDYITVGGPTGFFTIEPPNGCVGDTLCITATVIGAECASFDFRDGFVQQVCGLNNFIDTVSLCHQYNDPNTYSPIIVLQDQQGCIFTLTTPDSTTIFRLPQALIQPSDTLVCAPAALPFRDASIPGDSAINFWQWTLGPGLSSNQQNPVQVYPGGNADLTIRLLVRDVNGCEDSTTTTLRVREGIIANFAASDTAGCAPETITFTDLSSNLPAITWDWTFGDGGISSGVPNPVYTYQNDGIYDVTLIVSDSLGCRDTLTRDEYIVLQHPDANIYTNDTVGCNPVNITFYADSSVIARPVAQYIWCLTEINTGQVLCSSTGPRQDSLVVNFINAGEYRMTVTVVDDLGCRDTSEFVGITIINRTIPLPIEVRNVTVESDNSVRISWTRYPAPDFVEYAVYRLTGGAPLLVGTVSDQNTTFFVENAPTLDTRNNSYCYKVLVRNTCLELSRFDETLEHCTINLETTSATDAIILNWTPYVGYPVGEYEVFRANDYNPASAVQIGIVPGTQFTFTDTATFCRDSISYRVRAIGFGGPDQRSFSDLDANAPIHLQPTIPTHMVTATVVDDDYIDIAWEEYQGYKPAAYLIEKSLDGNTWALLDTVPLQPRTYSDTAVQVDERSYYYRVFALDSCGDRSVLGRVGKTILLNAVLDPTGEIPQLSWSAYREWLNGVLDYRVEVLNDQTGAFEFVSIVPGNQTSFPDDVTQLNQPTYCYRIIASEVAGNDATSVSNVRCITFGPAIYVPSAFTPNNDGINERFLVFAPNTESVELRIYNRWGQLLYISNNLDEGWDGRYNGVPSPEGVYVFTVEGVGFDGTTFTRQGTVTLLR